MNYLKIALLFIIAASISCTDQKPVSEQESAKRWFKGNLHTHSYWSDGDEFPEVISKATKFSEPHRLPNYLQELAAAFHRFYHHHRVVSEDKGLTQARLILVECTRIVLANALKILGVTAPERM